MIYEHLILIFNSYTVKSSSIKFNLILVATAPTQYIIILKQ